MTLVNPDCLRDVGEVPEIATPGPAVAYTLTAAADLLIAASACDRASRDLYAAATIDGCEGTVRAIAGWAALRDALSHVEAYLRAQGELL